MLNFVLGALLGTVVGFWACALLTISDTFGDDD